MADSLYDMVNRWAHCSVMAQAMMRDIKLGVVSGDFCWEELEQCWVSLGPTGLEPLPTGKQGVCVISTGVSWVKYTSDMTHNFHRGDGGPALIHLHDEVEWWMMDNRVDNDPETILLEREWLAAEAQYDKARISLVRTSPQIRRLRA